MWIHWPFFPKTWTKAHWPLDDLWSHVCWGHMCDSTKGSLCPSPMTINVCGYSDQFCKIPHTYTYSTYYIQNEWSHSLLLNSVQARQKPSSRPYPIIKCLFVLEPSIFYIGAQLEFGALLYSTVYGGGGESRCKISLKKGVIRCGLKKWDPLKLSKRGSFSVQKRNFESKFAHLMLKSRKICKFLKMPEKGFIFSSSFSLFVLGGGGYLVERWVRGCAAQIGCFFGLSGFAMAPFLFENWFWYRSRFCKMHNFRWIFPLVYL